MYKSLKISSTILLLTFFITSCVNNQQFQELPEKIGHAQPSPLMLMPPSITTKSNEKIPHPPKLKTINWDASIQPLITNMLKVYGIKQGSILLIDRIKNSTNGNLQIDSAMSALQSALANNKIFTLVSSQQIIQAKQTFGLSMEDSLVSRSKAIGLARYAGAQYLLYSNAHGDIKAPELQMLLMLVKTGEIIWSGHGNIQY